MTRETIQKYLKEHPEKRHRKFIPQIVAELTEVPPEKQIAVKVALRRLQEEIPNDERGQHLEEKWHFDNGYMSKENTKTFNINGQLFTVSNRV